MVLPISEMISQIKLPMFLELLDICDWFRFNKDTDEKIAFNDIDDYYR